MISPLHFFAQCVITGHVSLSPHAIFTHDHLHVAAAFCQDKRLGRDSQAPPQLVDLLRIVAQR